MRFQPVDAGKFARRLCEDGAFSPQQAERLAEALFEAVHEAGPRGVTGHNAVTPAAPLPPAPSREPFHRSRRPQRDIARIEADIVRWKVGIVALEVIFALGVCLAVARVIG